MRQLLIAIVYSGYLCGCANINNPLEDPTIDLPDKYSFVLPVAAQAEEQAEWWRNFNDPVLNVLIEQALRENLSVAQARARVDEARSEARRAGVVFQGSGTVDYRTGSLSSDRASASLSSSINLARSDIHASRAALARLSASNINTLEAKRIVLSEVANTYTNLRFFQESRSLLELDTVSRRRFLRDTRTLLESGEGTRLDDLRARTLIAETKQQILEVEAQIVLSQNRLATLIGKPVGLVGLDLSYKGRQLRPNRQINVGIPADLLRMRPDIRSAERLYAAAVSDVAEAEALRYPRLSLSGDISVPISGGSITQSLVSGLVLPVFDQAALKASADASRSRVEQAYLQWQIAVLNAVQEVEDAQALFRSALLASELAKSSVELNEEALEAARELVTAGGNVSFIDVLDRERSLSASRSNLAQSHRNETEAYIALQVAIGQGHPLLPPYTPED